MRVPCRSLALSDRLRVVDQFSTPWTVRADTTKLARSFAMPRAGNPSHLVVWTDGTHCAGELDGERKSVLYISESFKAHVCRSHKGVGRGSVGLCRVVCDLDTADENTRRSLAVSVYDETV